MNWYWTIWLFVALPLSFGVAEALAIKYKRPTLSRYIWNLSKAFPAFPWIAGVLTGFLADHFWWSGVICFNPPGH